MVVAFSEDDIPDDTIVSTVQIKTIARFSQIVRISSGKMDVFDGGGFAYSSNTKTLSIRGFLSYGYSSEIKYTVVYI